MARAARQLQLAGVLASAVTPHRAEAPEVDFSGALDLLDFLAGAGVQGIALFGATGEFLNYSFMERQRLVYLGSKRSRVPLLADVSHATLAGAIQLADEAISAGADGLLLMPPYFFDYRQPEIEQFYLQFARETSGAVPVVIQNLPRFTSSLTIDTICKLMDSGCFSGIVDCSGDWDYFEKLLAMKGPAFKILVGSERIATRALAQGADGILSSCASAIPELLVGLSKAVASRDEAKTEKLDCLLQEFLDWTDKFPDPVAIKRAVALRKQKSGPPLVPLAPGTSQRLEEFSAWFVNQGFVK